MAIDDLHDHVAAVVGALAHLEAELPRVDSWGRQLAAGLVAGGRLLTVGNGGSAAQAEHLAAELVGRYRGERGPLSALALSAPGATVTALANDYGMDALFARQVEAHGRPGDVLVALSTSGRSPDLLAAVATARAAGITTWALTGGRPNPLADAVDDALCVDARNPATVQEVHQIVVHLLCEALEQALPDAAPLAVG
jgi:D-sedoheptulose 7-phosphate isomerase